MNDTSQRAGAEAIEKLIQRFGCLPSAGDGPIVARFDPEALAAAIETEIRRAHEYGWSKITLHMDIPDAALLSNCLRRRKG